MKQYLKIIGVMAVLANLLGCATMQDSSEATQQQEDTLLLKEDLNRTKGKLETLEMPKSEIYQATQKLEKSQSEGKWTVAKFVYVTKTGEYAGAW